MTPEPLPIVKPGDAVRAEHHNALVRAIRRRTPVSSPTVDVVETSSGFYCSSKSGGGGGGMNAFSGNWKPTSTNSETVTISSGTIFDGATTTIVPDTTVNVTSGELNYIYLECTLSPSFIDGYVVGGIVTGASILSDTDVRINGNTVAYILLCTWQDGLVDRYQWFSFNCEMVNSGTGNTVFYYWAS